MSADSYRHIRRSSVVAVMALVAVFVWLFYWYGSRERQLDLTHIERTVGSLLIVALCLLCYFFLQQTLKLKQANSILEKQRRAFELLGEQLKSSAMEWQHMFDSVEDSVWLLDMNRTILRGNRASQNIFGRSLKEVVGLHCCEATYGKIVPRNDCPFEVMEKTGKRSLAQFELNSTWYEVSVDPVFDAQNRIVNAIYMVKNINALKKAEQRELLRSGILELIAGSEPLAQQLTFIVLSIEKESPGIICSVLMASDDGQCLLNGVAPSLPDFYNRATDRIKIGEGIGSCGTAAYRRERVIVEDIDNHPFWKGFAAAREAGLRSCWSEPIISSSGVR